MDFKLATELTRDIKKIKGVLFLFGLFAKNRPGDWTVFIDLHILVELKLDGYYFVLLKTIFGGSYFSAFDCDRQKLVRLLDIPVKAFLIPRHARLRHRNADEEKHQRVAKRADSHQPKIGSHGEQHREHTPPHQYFT